MDNQWLRQTMVFVLALYLFFVSQILMNSAMKTMGDATRFVADRVALSRREIRCDVIYRDTDGLILCVSTLRESSFEGADDVSDLNKGPKFNAIDADQQREYEALIVRLINRTFRRYNCPLIAVDLEDSGVETRSIMGKKKYWKTLELARGRFVTKGFEKNAQAFVKLNNVSHIVPTESDSGGDGTVSFGALFDPQSGELYIRCDMRILEKCLIAAEGIPDCRITVNDTVVPFGTTDTDSLYAGYC
ncbi:hypothetical protein EAI_01717 [Harpegnathos saltator]|uniref:Uncharacterized protein n=1 Tax=Harpegnathos saltator TaxID=610380 RepID=E2BGF8_HARSA|nr:hypothetical protein EAI_01717 [Harpegnathos saltator]